MKLIENDQRRWDFLAHLVEEQGIHTFVEVGCKEGRTTGFLVEKNRDLIAYAVDPWKAMPQQAGIGETYEDWDFAKIEAQFWANVGTHKHRVKMLRKTSLEAAEQFADESIGLVFIDAAHDLDNCVADIRAWWPKVKPDGVLAGHDYQHAFPGVMRAVAKEFCLMDVGLGPDSVWFIRKRSRREQAA